MRNRIVVKLFLFTTALCMFILATILIGQTIFFKKYYADQKVENVKTNINSFEKTYFKKSGNKNAMQKLERDFQQKNHAWITMLDHDGNPKNTNDFYLEVKLDPSRDKRLSNKRINIPLYNLVNTNEPTNEKLPFSKGMRISIYSIKKGSTFVPYVIARAGTFPRGTFGTLTPGQLEMQKGPFLENKVLEEKVGEILDQKHSGKRDTEQQPYSGTVDEHNRKHLGKQGARSSVTMVTGTIKNVVQPNGNVPFIYSDPLFMERIKTFQANLLLSNVQYRDHSFHVLDHEQNGIKYKQFIKPIEDKNGGTAYIFSMVSLQPVDEAMQMFKTYSIYIVGFVFLLIILASSYYSKTIARPLLRINRTTRKIANLDFTESVPVSSKDEIGDLSRNINLLSDTLHSHIERLQHDIEKEKQLENTRKEFISGVSHELKTPLSIMKSCISILKDGVAVHKREHYLEALEKEVDRMDLLIVDMLELAKFESGTYKMKMEPFYINQAIEDVRGKLSLEITKKELHVYTSVDRAEVIANPQRIEQVLINLLTNAIRYTPKGQDIIISTEKVNQQIKVSIENKGTHIESEQLDKIWDRFYRGDSSRRRSSGGTGLGLAISKNILELHGVQYGVFNTKDGVEFYFYLNTNG